MHYSGQTNLRDLVNPRVSPWNYDIYQGIECRIDLTKPVGERISELRFKGEEVGPDQALMLALNNYRAGGGGGYLMLLNGKRLSESEREIREVIAEYLAEKGSWGPDEVDSNWSVVPSMSGLSVR